MKANTLALQFDLHTRLFNNVLDGISDADADRRASETVNHIKWVAGHLLSMRYAMKDLAGLDVQDPFADVFAHGVSIDDNADYPSIADIRGHWNEISGKISPAIANLPSEVADAPSPFELPISDKTLGGSLTFLMHHEAYHLGQMGILRKHAGKDAMSYA